MMKILIVDDEPLVRKSLSRACRSKGHEVVEAVDGTEGLAKWRETTPDLVFLDVLDARLKWSRNFCANRISRKRK